MMRLVFWLILLLLTYSQKGINPMSNPVFKLPIANVCYDADGAEVKTGISYLLEWLRKNLVLNGNLETWDTTPTNWEVDVFGGSVASDTGYEGSYCARLKTVGGSLTMASIQAGYSYDISINRSKTYRLIYATKYPVSAGSLSFYIRMQFYNSAGSAIGTSSDIFIYPSVSADWTVSSYILTPEMIPVNTSKIRIKFLLASTIEAYAYIDAVSLTHYNPASLEVYSDYAELKSEDLETFTFPMEPLVGSTFHSADNPQSVSYGVDGTPYFDVLRYPARSWELKMRLTSWSQVNQLRRFHAKTRGRSFVYYDQYGDVYTVIWPGGFEPPAFNPQNIYIVTIPLTTAYITTGE